MFLLPRIDHVSDIGDCDGGFCDVCGNYEFTTPGLHGFEDFVLLICRQRRIKLEDHEVCYMTGAIFANWLFLEVLALSFYLFIILVLHLSLFYIKSAKLNLQFYGHFMDLLFTGKKNKDIPWWQLLMNLDAFLHCAVDIVFGSVSFMEDCDGEHFCLYFQDRDMKIEKIFVLKVSYSESSGHYNQS